MATASQEKKQTNGNDATTELAPQLWATANALRGNIDAAEYKHVVLPLMFLKYISDAFEELHEELESKVDEGHDPEQPDEYRERNVFWVPQEARWNIIQSRARQEDNGATIDRAMDAIERDNDSLKGVLPKNFGSDNLDKQVLGQVVDLVSNIRVGGAEAQATDVLGQVYEYFLEQFAIAEGRKGGEFYTPRSVVRLLVEMIEPYEGRVFDPCCGSAGMFVQSVKFIEAHAKGNGNGNGKRHQKPVHPRAGVQPDHPPAGEDEPGHPGHRRQYPVRGQFPERPPPGPQGQLHPGQSPVQHLRLERGATQGRQEMGPRDAPGGERQLRMGATLPAPPLIPEASRGSYWPTGPCPRTPRERARSGRTSSRPTWSTASSPCQTSCFGQLEYRHVCGSCPEGRSRRRDWERQGQTLFIDARKMGHMLNRTLRDLSEEDIARIAGTYHAWRDGEEYEDDPGFCKSATLEEIQKHGHVLTPGRYVGAAPQEDDGEPFQEKMARLTAQWREQQEEAQQLDVEIAANLERLGF